MESVEQAEFLERTADLFESGQAEWCQGTMFGSADLPPAACLLGAIHLTARNSSHRGPLFAIIMSLQKRLTMPIGTWNDAKGRTKQDVIDLLKNTAKDLRNEGDPQ